MKLRTLSKLYDFLDAELSWRKQELVNLKLLHDRAHDHQKEMLRRAGIALLYAHWEGFVKAAGTGYLNYVQLQRHPYNALKSNFIALGAKKTLSEFSATSKGRALCRASHFFVNQLHLPANFHWKRAVQTASNLSSDVARDIIAILGLDYTPFEVHERAVMEQLRTWRNTVAHGRIQEVLPADYNDQHRRVLQLLDLLDTQIRNAATTKAYLAQPS